MLVRQQRLDLRMVQKLGHELDKHLAVLQPIAVLCENGRVPDRVIGRKPHEPAVQQIVVQLPHQLAFRADGVEHLKQQRAQQLLRRSSPLRRSRRREWPSDHPTAPASESLLLSRRARGGLHTILEI